MNFTLRFQPPISTQSAIKRRAILSHLSAGGLKRVTTIIAPAGYGKTSLAAQWFDTLRAEGYSLSWLALDQEYSDQTQFLLLLLEAVNALRLEEGTGVDSSMTVASLLALLSTRLRKITEPVILFLDDYHFAQTDATEAIVARLLGDQTLNHLKLVLISRTPPRFPVSALRLKGEFRQVNIAELGFSDQEAEEFFAGQTASLSREQVAGLNKRTEGWAVALQMIRLLIAENVDGGTLFTTFDGGNAEMGSYLSEQVFANLPEDVQELLLKTAPFPTVNRDLVEAVFADAHSADLLGKLGDHALPVALLAGGGGWIRYHPVFNAFLKEEAARRGYQVQDVLERAARWFQTTGDFDAAVRHALMSGNANLAAEIVETSGGWRRVYTTSRGGASVFNSIMANVSAIDLSCFPLTTLGLSVVSAKAGHLDAANHYLGIAERADTAAPDTFTSDLRVVRVLLGLYFDRPACAEDLAALENDLTDIASTELVHRAMVLNMLSYNFLDRSDMDRALHYGHLAVQTFRDGGADFGAGHLYTHIGQAAFFSGDCSGAEEYYQQLIDEVQACIGKGTDLDALGQVLKAELLVMRGDLEAAGPCLRWALPHLERHDAWFDLLAAGFTAQQMIFRLEGDMTAAHALADRTRSAAKRRGFHRLIRLIDGARVLLLLESGDVEQAIRYAKAHGFGMEDITSVPDNNLAIHLRGLTPALLWARIHLVRGDLERARQALSILISQQLTKIHDLRSVELALLDMRLLIAEEKREIVAARLEDLLLTFPMEDFRAMIWIEGDDFLGDLRAIAEESPMSAVLRQRLQALLPEGKVAPETSEDMPLHSLSSSALTDRELAVMALLSQGFSNKEIGRKLALSDNTIKFHLRNIFAKLKVTTRTAAVGAARRAGISL
ncbi:LuxR C-terminal-related transcriptional regulator [Agrobacterium vitis]|uniref:LuxR C-terminal-related transcriptional regulator n=1 Tax=Agrobacterium vitis TaxID=373 RepID=UPI0008FAF03C|nr:LuxR C-terminal-related transcriptional regulator [Agrobacterium vitis]OHZ41699.1 transcriptional regulator [Agrobacterium vitis]